MSKYVFDMLGLLGVILITVGIWQWSWPAALIFLGSFFLLIAIFGEMNDNVTKDNIQPPDD